MPRSWLQESQKCNCKKLRIENKKLSKEPRRNKGRDNWLKINVSRSNSSIKHKWLQPPTTIRCNFNKRRCNFNKRRTVNVKGGNFWAFSEIVLHFI